ncbi:MAG: hypothetical protein R3C59_29240 [Planctomycetaceae bacterium]
MKFRMITIVASLILAGSSSVSACCLFPFFPTYSAGYAPWGAGWGSAYRPVSYGYGASYGMTNCCPTGTCGTSYTASYAGFSSMGYSSGGCCSSCGPVCGCGSSCGGSCVSGCGSDCIGTESRKVPEPDRNYDSPSAEPRTFEDRTRDKELEDGFSRPGTTDDRRPLNDSNDPEWLKRRDDTTRPFGTESGTGTGTFDSRPFEDRNPPDTLDNRSFRPADEQPVVPEATEHNAKKPEITTPMVLPESSTPAASPTETTTPEDTVPPATDTDAPGTETDAADFLAPPAGDDPAAETDPASARNSHFEVLAMKRLAAGTRSSTKSATQLSSSRRESRSPRWISVPLPAGRARL